jgi:hypothetical protein
VTRPIAGLITLVVALLVGCTGPQPSGSLSTTAGPNTASGRIQFACGGAPSGFDAELLSTPGTAENGTDEVAPFLRAALAPGEIDGTMVPATGWHRIGRDNMLAQFANFETDQALVLEFRRTAGEGWELETLGICLPRPVLPDGARAATWVLDPGRLGPGPESTSFFALVTESACASGQRTDLRLLDPTVHPLEDRVYVLFAVQPLGGEGECPGDPPTSVTVQLGEPLGDRELVDPTTLFPDG